MNRAVSYRILSAATLLLLTVVCPRAFASGQGLAVEGTDHVRLRLDAAAAARVGDYANTGYRLTLAAAGEDGAREATVEVDVAPLASRSPYVRSEVEDEAKQGDVEKLTRALTADRKSTYGAVSAVLGWMVHNLVDETLTPPPPGTVPAAAGEAKKTDRQAPEAVRARGAGDARGIARLAVAMLTAAGVEARVVEGRVLGTPEIGAPHGEHSWIEVRYPDVGWAFSDPLHHHHYVPATYLPMPPAVEKPALAGTGASTGEAVAAEPRVELLERRDRRQTVDLYPPGAPGLTARKNRPQQVAAALRVVVSGATRGSAVLLGPEGNEAGGARVRKMLVGGESVFVGLAGGSYKLEVFL
ncbi:MAG TPA: transglutaminase domain-containing protein, partial [Thermoanaerobaculia bacterium]|nr:transglutaminase domain-containing protein [Thermoanaerobaculia bacterium]